MTGRLSVLGAVVTAGGIDKASAEPRSVVVVRYRDGKRYAALVDISTEAIQAEESVPFYLAPNDVVFVPRTRVDVLAQWVDDHVNRLVPAGFQYSQPGFVGGSTVGYETPNTRLR